MARLDRDDPAQFRLGALEVSKLQQHLPVSQSRAYLYRRWCGRDRGWLGRRDGIGARGARLLGVNGARRRDGASGHHDREAHERGEEDST